MFFLVAVILLGLPYSTKEASASFLQEPILDGPDVALVNEIVDFRCEVLTYPKDEHIHLQLFKKGDQSKLYAEYTSLSGEVGVFPLIVQAFHDGELECVASVQNNSLISSTVSQTHHFRVIEPVARANIVVQSGSTEVLVGEMLQLYCNVTYGTHVTYKWSVNGQPVSSSHSLSQADQLLFINGTTPQDTGLYMCVATNQFNETIVYHADSEVFIAVKESGSELDISFTVLKRDSQDVFALVNCQSPWGTPPMKFQLYNNSELMLTDIAMDQSAIFTVPVVLNQRMGWFQCSAESGFMTGYSKSILLEVVTVGGPVTLHFDHDIGGNFAVVNLALRCKAARGSHLQYQWFLNTTRLDEEGPFHLVFHRLPDESLLYLTVGRSSEGKYHCEVSDRFDNTTVMKSPAWYLTKEALNRLPDSIVGIVFGSFIFLVAFVSGCCCVRLVSGRRRCSERPLQNLDTRTVGGVYEDELDLGEYEENLNVVQEATVDDSDQVSLTSADEWPHVWELEDEPEEL